MNKTYEVSIKCGVLITTKVVTVSASSKEEAAEIVRTTSPYSTITNISEVQDG